MHDDETVLFGDHIIMLHVGQGSIYVRNIPFSVSKYSIMNNIR